MARQVTKARLDVTLKCGSKVWKKGTVFQAPIPLEIIQEMRLGTGTVKVLASKEAPPRILSAPIVNGKKYKTTGATLNLVDNSIVENQSPSSNVQEEVPIEPEKKGTKKKKLKKRVPIKKIKSKRT